MKKILAAVVAMMMLLTATVASAASFPDMEEERWDWARATVEELADMGIVRGYEDGTYRPENGVTRQEAFTLFSRVIGVNDETNAQAVADAQTLYKNIAENYNTYASRELCFMLYRGILKTEDLDEYLSDDTKNEPMKRHEAAKLITKILGGEEEIKNAFVFVFDYTDAETFPHDARGYISYVTENGIMSGMGDGTFSPDTGVTRAQIAIMLKRTMDKLDLEYISGAVSEVTEESLKVNGELVELKEDIIAHRDGEAVTVDKIENGDYAIVSKTSRGILAIDATVTEESESNTRIIEGIYRGSMTDSRGTFIKIYDKEGGVNTTETYQLTDGVVAYTVNGEKRASLSAITETDYVYAKMVAGRIVSIDAESKATQIANATFTSIGYVDGENMLTIGYKEEAYDGTAWPIADNVIVKRNGKDAALTDLLVGDTITLDFTYGEITKITATSKTSSVKGSITAIHIEKEQPYIVIKISDTKSQTIYLTLDTVINIDEKSSDIYDLVLGYNVTVSTESDTASKITVTSVATTNTVTGTVVLVNKDLGFINVSAVDPATGEVVTKQIFVNEKTSIRAASNSAIIKLTNLAEGDAIFASGLEKVGAFEATSIMVINK